MNDKAPGAYTLHEKRGAPRKRKSIYRNGDRLDLASQTGGRVYVGLASSIPNAHLTALSVPAEELRAALDEVSPSPVRECLDPDDHILARDYAAMSGRATRWQERAEKAEDTLRLVQQQRDQATARAAKAEQERDEARATKNMHKRRADEERARAVVAERERDEARARLAGVTIAVPDVTVTDDMVERALDAAYRYGAVVINKTIMREALAAALTEPPKRPEGAHQIAAVLADVPASTIGGPLTKHEADALADALAARGVRVVTEEQP